MSEFALIVPFAGLPGIVADWLERTVPTKPSHGMPPHVTVLYPAPDDVVGIAEALGPFGAFEVEFPLVDRFPGTAWLSPDPAEPFRAITEELVAAYPDFPPYRGVFAQIVPHLTIAQAELDEAASALEPWLPLRSRAETVVLLECVRPDHWREVATFDLEAG